MRIGGADPGILSFDTRRIWVISCTLAGNRTRSTQWIGRWVGGEVFPLPGMFLVRPRKHGHINGWAILHLAVLYSASFQMNYSPASDHSCYYSVQNLLYSSLLSKNLKIKIYRTIILPVVLYECEAWSLTLREERRLKVLENRVLRRVFGLRGTR
jgi:hypothetical protein